MMSKDTDMSEELTKLALERRDELLLLPGLAGQDRLNVLGYILRAHHAAEKAKAMFGGMVWPTDNLAAQARETIAALDSLILTPPVDPVRAEVEGLIDEIAPSGTIDPSHAAARKSAMRRLINELPKRGLELRASDGGGA